LAAAAGILEILEIATFADWLQTDSFKMIGDIIGGNVELLRTGGAAIQFIAGEKLHMRHVQLRRNPAGAGGIVIIGFLLTEGGGQNQHAQQ
jgi:hypothetical protein